MKSTGVVRQLDTLGRVVLPIELRRTMDIGVKDMLEIFVDGDEIILKKYHPAASSATTPGTLSPTRASSCARSAWKN